MMKCKRVLDSRGAVGGNRPASIYDVNVTYQGQTVPPFPSRAAGSLRKSESGKKPNSDPLSVAKSWAVPKLCLYSRVG